MPTASQNPLVTAVNNLGVTAQLVIASNPGRTKLLFHNPGTNDVIVFPTQVWVNGVATLLSAGSTITGLGGGFRVFANGGDRPITGVLAYFAWLAQAVSGSNNPLTITELS